MSGRGGVPTGEPIQWVESGRGLAGANRTRTLPALVILMVFVVLFLAIALANGGNRAALAVPLIEIVVFIAVFGLVWYNANNRATRSIGVWRGGVVLRRRSGDTNFGWNQIQPGLNPLPRGGVWFQSVTEGSQTTVGGFQATRDQARAIILSPFAPPWVLSATVAFALGVPAQRTPGPPGPSPPYSGTPPPPPPPAPPLVPAGAPIASTAAANPPIFSAPTAYSAPPIYVPSAAPLPSSRPAGPPPGTVACPRCGQFNPIGRTAFCQACGQRLPRAV